jgi:hypothetical protein
MSLVARMLNVLALPGEVFAEVRLTVGSGLAAKAAFGG